MKYEITNNSSQLKDDNKLWKYELVEEMENEDKNNYKAKKSINFSRLKMKKKFGFIRKKII